MISSDDEEALLRQVKVSKHLKGEEHEVSRMLSVTFLSLERER